MTYTDPEILAILKKVRNKTVDDKELLPDHKILEFADAGGDNVFDGALDWYGVYADAWEYLARAERYQTEQTGAVLVSGPLSMRMAALYRAMAMSGGTSMYIGILVRTDLTAADA